MPILAELCDGCGGPSARRSAGPPSTPAFQASLLYGRHDLVHGYSWFDRERGRVRRFDVPEDVTFVERQLAAGASRPPLLAVAGGASYLMLFVGGAGRALLTIATGLLPSHRPRLGRLWAALGRGFRIAPVELARGAVDLARFARRRRTLRFEFNWLAMRTLNAAFFEEYAATFAEADLEEDAPIVTLDFFSYDEAAHRRGPDHPVALEQLGRIDARVGRLVRVARRRGYEVVIMSDHGQAPCAWFADVAGESLASLVFRACAPRPVEPDRRFKRLVERLDLARIRSARLRKWPDPFGRLAASKAEVTARTSARQLERGHGIPAGELAVVTGGSIAHVYVGREPEGASLEEIEARYPRLMDELTRSPGVGVLVARRAGSGPRVFFGGRAAALDDRAALAEMAPFRAVGVDELRRLIQRVAGVATAGDLICYGAFAPAGSVSFDPELGSHGGIHPEELDMFVVQPDGMRLPDGAELDPAELNAILRDRYALAEP